MISIGMLRDVWAFRGFITSCVRRNFYTRFVNTRLGFLWEVLQPLTMILIYTLLFAAIMKPSLPGTTSRFAYSIYLCSGIIIWGLFSELVGSCVGIFVKNGYLLKKISFPKLCLPLVEIFTSLINFSIIYIIFIIFLIFTKNFPGFIVVTSVPIMLIVIALAVGLGIVLGTINVFYRDIEKTVGIILQFWFWLTPIVYINKSPSPIVTTILKINPLASLIEAMHSIFVYHCYPSITSLVYPLVLAGIFIYLGIYSFWKLQSEIVDVL